MHRPQYKLEGSVLRQHRRGGLGVGAVSQGGLTQKTERKPDFEGGDEHELGPKNDLSKRNSMRKAQRQGQGLVRQQ